MVKLVWYFLILKLGSDFFGLKLSVGGDPVRPTVTNRMSL